MSPQKITDEKIVQTVAKLYENGEAIGWNGGVTVDRITEELPLSRGATKERLRRLANQDRLEKGWGITDGQQRVTYEPVEDTDATEGTTQSRLTPDGGRPQMPDQPTLVDEETATETAPATVWVVASRKEDSPHPSVNAVYDNEDAAREHRRELANNSFQHGVIAWEVYERPVHTDTAINGGDAE